MGIASVTVSLHNRQFCYVPATIAALISEQASTYITFLFCAKLN